MTEPGSNLQHDVQAPGTTPTAAPAAGPTSASATAAPPARLATLLTMMAVIVIAVALVLQERSINELQRQVGVLQSNAHAIAMQAASGQTPTVINVAGAPALGPADAKVTLIEFSDYECPYCIRHFTTTMPELRAAYIDTNRIRYVFKDFPIDENHPMAIKAHEAAHCALEQQKFWALHVHLFSPPGTHTPDQLDARAREAGLDMPAFTACIASGRTDAGIRQSAQLASRLGADGTPAFFIGVRDPATDDVRVTKTIDGAQPFSEFQGALDGLLNSLK